MSQEIQDLFIPTEIPQPPIVQNVGYTTKEMSILRASPGQPGVFSLVLGSLNEDGTWRTDVPLRTVRIEDNPTATDTAVKYAATIMQQLIFTAICADIPANQTMNVVGISVWDAGKVLLPAQVVPNASG